MIKKYFGLLLLIFAFSTMNAQVQIQKVEASFIANFMRYIQWPGQSNMKTLKVGVYGKNTTIYKELSKTVHGKNVGLAVLNVVEITDIQSASDCQLLFIPNGKANRLRSDIESISGKSILIITEEQEYSPKYSMINFKVVNSKLGFELNNQNASSKNISISSRLEQMAL